MTPSAAQRDSNNIAIMRTIPLTMVYYADMRELIQATVEVARVTHPDPRCIASCVAINLAIACV